GAAANREILQVMADVFGAAVYRIEAGNSACLGAALRAVHARAKSEGRPLSWDAVVRAIAEPLAGGAVQPNHSHTLMYRELMRVYTACEAHALGRGPDPAPLLADFGARFGGGSGKV